MSFSSNKTKPDNIDLASSQTLANKTLDGTNVIQSGVDIQTPAIISPIRLDPKKDTYANLVTYAASAQNGELVYATDAKVQYQVKDGLLVEIGSGVGEINHIENGNFEQDITGVSVTDALKLDVSHETVSPLRGDGSLKISKIASINSSNAEVYIDFTVDPADLAEMLTLSFDYDLSDAAYADNDAIIVITQDPSGTPVELAINNADLKGGKGKKYAQFQTHHTIRDYRLSIRWIDTGTTAVDAYIDNVAVSPTRLARGAIITASEAFTPVWKGASSDPAIGNGVLSGRYARQGDIMFGYINMASGSTTTFGSGDWYFEIPDGLNVKGILDRQAVGTVFFLDNSSSAQKVGVVRYSSFYDGLIFNAHDSGITSSTIPFTWEEGDDFTLEFTLPIQGWEASGTLNEDLGGGDVVVEVSGTSTSIPVTTDTKVVFSSVDKDTASIYSSGDITIPSSGTYSLSSIVQFSSGGYTASSYFALRVYKNNSLYKTIDTFPFVNSSQQNILSGSINSIDAVKGDVFDIRARHDFGANLVPTAASLSFVKLASGSQKFDTATVAARYTSNNGQVFASGGTLEFEDLDYDTHGSYNTTTGVYSVPLSGYYKVCSAILTDTETWTSGFVVGLSINVDLSDVVQRYAYHPAYTGSASVLVCSDLYLTVGQSVKIVATSDIATNLNASGLRNYFSIHRIK